MENLTEVGWIGMISILTAGLTIAIGAIAPPLVKAWRWRGPWGP
jgi:hypothetical protein